MLGGSHGPARQWAMEHMVRVGDFFDAADFVPVTQAHIMADTESLGEAGVVFLERFAALPGEQRRVLVPMITDPRGTDFDRAGEIGQTREMVSLERRASAALEALGILMTNTCINYQTISPPARGEHLAFGDTGVVIYCNSVLGARSNFEGGPSALAAGLTGRVPRYGCHLDRNRRATHRFRVRFRPQDLAEWGALGAMIGSRTGSYWGVPVIEGLDSVPSSDALKHLGAAMASFGSTPLFHLVGVTPEAPDLDAVCDPAVLEPVTLGGDDLAAFFRRYDSRDGRVDVVVFSAPQLSLFEMQDIAGLLGGRQVHPDTALLVVTSPAVYADARRFGIVARLEAAGAMVLKGMCFYQSYARELGHANGWRRLMTNSAKLANIIGGYGYRPVLASMARCVDSAVSGKAS